MADRKPILGKGAATRIGDAIDVLYDLLKAKLLGPQSLGAKGIRFTFDRPMSLPGIYEAAALAESTAPNLEMLQRMLDVAGNYVEASRDRTKAKAVQEIHAFLQDAHAGRIKEDLETVLQSKVADIFKDATNQVQKIVGAESNQVKNTGLLQGILKVAASENEPNPTVFWVVVRSTACDECMRLHMLEDRKTPRVWKMSEVGSGTHKKGQPNPKVGGLHPNCMCQMSACLRDYGFNENGFIKYKGPGWDEYSYQRTGNGFPNKAPGQESAA